MATNDLSPFFHYSAEQKHAIAILRKHVKRTSTLYGLTMTDGRTIASTSAIITIAKAGRVVNLSYSVAKLLNLSQSISGAILFTPEYPNLDAIADGIKRALFGASAETIYCFATLGPPLPSLSRKVSPHYAKNLFP